MTEDKNSEISISIEQLCPYSDECRMLASMRDKLPKLVARLQDDYCRKNHRACARRWVRDFLGAESVPELMMPQQHDWAEQVLFEAGVHYTDFQKRYQLVRTKAGTN